MSGCGELDAPSISGMNTLGPPAALHCGCFDGRGPMTGCRSVDIVFVDTVFPDERSVAEESPQVLSQAGRIATGLTTRQPGQYRYDLRSLDDGGSTWQFAEHTYLVDDEGGVFRHIRRGTRSIDGSQDMDVSETDSAQIDPEAIDGLAEACVSVYAHERFECVHDIVSTAEAVGQCALGPDGEPL